MRGRGLSESLAGIPISAVADEILMEPASALGPIDAQIMRQGKVFSADALIEGMEKMAFQARNTARAAHIYCKMLEEQDCAVILCLAGSLISAGLKKVIVQMLEQNMVDAIVSTGANIVDQDFFEGLGFSHWQG